MKRLQMVDYENVSIDEWSESLVLKWDLNLKNLIWNSHSEKEAYYEEEREFMIGWVDLADLFYSIPEMHQLSSDEIWNIREKHKINGAINFWKNGKSMTPMLIDTFHASNVMPQCCKNGDDIIIIRAGFHRFSVCCLMKEKRIPFITPISSKSSIEKLVPRVTWKA